MTAPGHSEPRGYHRLANLMGHYPEAAIFRRFNSLNMLNLLSLQAELVDLQIQFGDMCAEDDESTDVDEKEFSTYFRKMRNSADSLQYETLLDIRRKLNDYNAALIQVAQARQLPCPETADVEFLRGWLRGAESGENFLRGSEEFTWKLPSGSTPRDQKFFEKDFVTMYNSTAEQDVFSKILSTSLLDLWIWLKSCGVSSDDSMASMSSRPPAFQKNIDPNSDVLHYSEQSLLRINNIIVSVISATLPVVAIVALFFIQTEGGRIGAMAGFTVAFALALAVFTNARRLEIAASTAAFAAVEVVFIGSDLAKSGG